MGIIAGAKTLLLNALAQTDVDMAGHKLLNLDTSNLSISGLPPDVSPPAHNFLNGWTRIGQIWSFAQPSFGDLAGNLSGAQQLAITQLGTIATGVWQGTVVAPNYLPTLDLIQQPAADVSMNSFKLTNVANPVSANDAVNLVTAQGLSSGLQVKAPVAAASAGVHTSLSGLTLPIDGYFPQAGDRILVKDQPTGFHYQNGIYIAATGSWTRATDADTSAKLVGAFAMVLNGVANGGSGWVQVTPAPINLISPDGGTEPVFVQFNHAAQHINAGPGLQLMGNTMSAVGTVNRIAIGVGIDIDNNYAGQASINTLGTITKGNWTAGIIGPAFGGTGINNTGSITLSGNFAVQSTGFGTRALTFIIGADTTVTLPSSGVMATLAGVETLTNKSIDAGQITGILPVGFGGTGANNQVQAAKNVLPSIIGQAGKSLKTDGASIFWG